MPIVLLKRNDAPTVSNTPPQAAIPSGKGDKKLATLMLENIALGRVWI
jgi:hypothetical protein